ncbi:MAG: carbohydrate ABC transporter permease [Candidatus Methylomirabilales bacterium]
MTTQSETKLALGRVWSRGVPGWEGIVFVAPAVLVLAAVVAFPVADVLVLSLYKTVSRTRSIFVGLGNYQRLWADPGFWSALRNSIAFTAGSVLGHVIIGLGFALVLNGIRRGRTLFRVVSLVPWMFSAVVVAITWRWMLDAQFGIINHLLTQLGIWRGPILWFENPSLALPALIMTNIWRGFPFASVALLAALQTIPNEQYEAAAVDGAMPFQRFCHITLPNLRFTLTVVVTLDTIWNFKHFDLVQVMTNGGPAGATEVLTTLAYKVSFENFQFGYAAAMAVVMSLVLLATTVIYVRRIL